MWPARHRRDSAVQVVLRINTSISPDCNVGKRSAASSALMSIAVASPSTAAARALQKSMSKPAASPVAASTVPKPARPLLPPQLSMPRSWTAASVLPPWVASTVSSPVASSPVPSPVLSSAVSSVAISSAVPSASSSSPPHAVTTSANAASAPAAFCQFLVVPLRVIHPPEVVRSPRSCGDRIWFTPPRTESHAARNRQYQAIRCGSANATNSQHGVHPTDAPNWRDVLLGSDHLHSPLCSEVRRCGRSRCGRHRSRSAAARGEPSWADSSRLRRQRRPDDGRSRQGRSDDDRGRNRR